MSQSKKGSLTEVSITTAIGYVVSVVLGQYLYPLFGYDLTLGDNAGLTAIFVSVSMIIKYTLRRYFNRRQERK